MFKNYVIKLGHNFSESYSVEMMYTEPLAHNGKLLFFDDYDKADNYCGELREALYKKYGVSGIGMPRVFTNYFLQENTPIMVTVDELLRLNHDMWEEATEKVKVKESSLWD